MKANATGFPTQSTQDRSKALNPFRVLRHREFRLLWVGLAISAIGTWMQIVALSLLVLKITYGSAFALGTVSLTQALSFFFFALIGGNVADRIDCPHRRPGARDLNVLDESRNLIIAVATGSAAAVERLPGPTAGYCLSLTFASVG